MQSNARGGACEWMEKQKGLERGRMSFMLSSRLKVPADPDNLPERSGHLPSHFPLRGHSTLPDRTPGAKQRRFLGNHNVTNTKKSNSLTVQ